MGIIRLNMKYLKVSFLVDCSKCATQHPLIAISFGSWKWSLENVPQRIYYINCSKKHLVNNNLYQPPNVGGKDSCRQLKSCYGAECCETSKKVLNGLKDGGTMHDSTSHHNADEKIFSSELRHHPGSLCLPGSRH